MTHRMVFVFFLLFAYLTFSNNALAWGPDGHTTVGTLAMDQLRPGTRSQLEQIMGSLDPKDMLEACNWPDVVRETDEWALSYPWHYINIPRGEFEYQKPRDCPEGQCATEAIKRFATELGNPGLSKEKRWQAFAWLCHFTGDLHQPLHAGFADDRGANDVEVIFRGEQINLHRVWDSRLIARHADNDRQLSIIVGKIQGVEKNDDWSPDMVNRWTENSHKLATEIVYPPSANIDEAYEKQSWEIIQQRLSLAATHLAQIINTVLE